MTSDEFFAGFHASAFRLETLPQYLGTSDAAFRAFCEGRPLPLSERPAKQDWMRRVTDARAQGKRIYRVHVLDQPLTPYLQYELAAWLLDADSDKPFALLMHYDAEGRFLNGEPSEVPVVIEKCRHRRNLALANSVPLDQFLSTSITTGRT